MAKNSLVILLLLSSLLSGCGGSEAQPGLTLAGSTSVEPFAELLAEAYMAQNSGSPPINVQGGGSSAGIQAAQTGTADIGMSSRWLREEEGGLLTVPIAYDAIAIIVHPRNPVSNLALEEVRGIFAGRITNWAEVGGMEGRITVVTREEGSGTRGAFQELVMGEERIATSALRQDSNGAVRVIVAGDEEAIGYISLGIVNEKVKSLRIEGVQPSVESVKEGKYGLVRPFLFVLREEPSGLAREFIDYVLSPQGQGLLAREGLVSLEG